MKRRASRELRREPRPRIAAEVVHQHIKDIGLLRFEIVRPAEVGLGCVGEELAWIVPSMFREERFSMRFQSIQVPLVRGRHDPLPAGFGFASRQRRRAVRFAIEKIELVGEFVDRQVEAQVGLGGLGFDIRPVQNDRPPIPGLPPMTLSESSSSS